jgi:hypothetical protein
MSTEEELKSLEAELALLRPQSARLDRDRLMFLAGQASAGGKNVRRTTRAWLWPAALATMTSAAAALLVMLVSWPRVEIVERIVEVPVQSAGGDVRTAHDEQSPQREAERRPDAEPERILPQPAPSRLAAVLGGWLPAADWSALQLKASYPSLRDAVLAHGLDSLPSQPAGTASGGGTDAAPSSYRQLRESLLEIPPAGPPSKRPARGMSFFSGAHS